MYKISEEVLRQFIRERILSAYGAYDTSHPGKNVLNEGARWNIVWTPMKKHLLSVINKAAWVSFPISKAWFHNVRKQMVSPKTVQGLLDNAASTRIRQVYGSPHTKMFNQFVDDGIIVKRTVPTGHPLHGLADNPAPNKVWAIKGPGGEAAHYSPDTFLDHAVSVRHQMTDVTDPVTGIVKPVYTPKKSGFDYAQNLKYSKDYTLDGFAKLKWDPKQWASLLMLVGTVSLDDYIWETVFGWSPGDSLLDNTLFRASSALGLGDKGSTKFLRECLSVKTYNDAYDISTDQSFVQSVSVQCTGMEKPVPMLAIGGAFILFDPGTGRVQQDRVGMPALTAALDSVVKSIGRTSLIHVLLGSPAEKNTAGNIISTDAYLGADGRHALQSAASQISTVAERIAAMPQPHGAKKTPITILDVSAAFKNTDASEEDAESFIEAFESFWDIVPAAVGVAVDGLKLLGVSASDAANIRGQVESELKIREAFLKIFQDIEERFYVLNIRDYVAHKGPPTRSDSFEEAEDELIAAESGVSGLVEKTVAAMANLSDSLAAGDNCTSLLSKIDSNVEEIGLGYSAMFYAAEGFNPYANAEDSSAVGAAITRDPEPGTDLVGANPHAALVATLVDDGVAVIDLQAGTWDNAAVAGWVNTWFTRNSNALTESKNGKAAVAFYKRATCTEGDDNCPGIVKDGSGYVDFFKRLVVDNLGEAQFDANDEQLPGAAFTGENLGPRRAMMLYWLGNGQKTKTKNIPQTPEKMMPLITKIILSN